MIRITHWLTTPCRINYSTNFAPIFIILCPRRHSQVQYLRLQPPNAELVEFIVVLQHGLHLGLGLGAHGVLAMGGVVDAIWMEIGTVLMFGHKSNSER